MTSSSTPIASPVITTVARIALLDIDEAKGIAGAFVYQFIELGSTYDPDPQFGIVKTFPAEAEHPYETTGYWEPRQAFTALAGMASV